MYICIIMHLGGSRAYRRSAKGVREGGVTT